jgi:DUF971 family protein
VTATTTPHPTEVRRDKDARTLTVSWADGGTTRYEYDTLRGYCPCAGCQGHMVRELRFRPPRRPVEPLTIDPVGNYGLSILWSDGHSTGIYRFDFLRRLEAAIENGGPIRL